MSVLLNFQFMNEGKHINIHVPRNLKARYYYNDTVLPGFRVML